MAEKIRLSEAIEAFLAFRKSNGIAVGTRRNEGHVLRRFLLVNGDLFVATLGDRHVDKHLQVASASRGDGALGIDHTTLRAFFAWAVRGRYIAKQDDPMADRKAPKRTPVEKRRLEVGRFPEVLDAAGVSGARDRMVVALGLHLFLRGSEVKDLRYRDLRLDSGEMSVRIFKTKQIDVMPISAELDEELRRWLRYYAEECGPIQQSWYLVPARKRGGGYYNKNTGKFGRSPDAIPLNPVRPIHEPENIPQRALERIGWELRDEDGASLREGVHTLRRSGARALFDQLRGEGYDGAMRTVQAMLHHKAISTTEGYIGMDLDRVHRNESIRGRRMYGSRDNVVSIQKAREA